MTILETENLTHYYENGMAGAVAAIWPQDAENL